MNGNSDAARSLRTKTRRDDNNKVTWRRNYFEEFALRELSARTVATAKAVGIRCRNRLSYEGL